MNNVFEMRRNKLFTLEEATSLLPLIKRITMEAVNRVEALKKRVEEMDPEPEHYPYYEHELTRIVEHWSDKIEKLGCEGKGLWVVDFDNGQGYYCWQYPEEGIGFFHAYDAGLESRTPIA